MASNTYVSSGIHAIKLAPCHAKLKFSSTHVPSNHASTASPKHRNLSISCQARKDFTFQGGSSRDPFAASSSFMNNEHGKLSLIKTWIEKKGLPRNSVVPRALKPLLSVYPQMTTKPKWWWRALACFPYLLPLHKVWLYADAVYQLHSLLEDWSFLANPFIDTYILFPGYGMMIIYGLLYFYVVRRKEWPHFLRFHVVMAMLVENALEVVAISCRWWPNTVYRGQLAMHFWIAVAIAQAYTVLKCMWCALTGKYADVPLVSDAAYIQSDTQLMN